MDDVDKKSTTKNNTYKKSNLQRHKYFKKKKTATKTSIGDKRSN